MENIKKLVGWLVHLCREKSQVPYLLFERHNYLMKESFSHIVPLELAHWKKTSSDQT